MKKIITITNVKNESDIIESFCRYNLSYCDGMLIYENNKSTDNTREIIQKLISEGLPIFFADEVEVKRYVAAKTEIAKLAINKYGADLVVPLDADEFLSHIDGENPREELESLRENVEYQVKWRTYVYEKEPDLEQGFLPFNFTRYRNPALDVQNKALASRWLIKEKKAEFSPGAHYFEYPKDYKDSVAMEVHQKLVMSHYPLRSKTQMMNKAVPNWICKWRETFPEREGHGYQLGIIWDELKENGEISYELITRFSLEYSVPDYILAEVLPTIENSKTIEGMIDTGFCSDKLQLRYTDYKEAEKTFMRATLTEFELTLASLPKREWETIRLLDAAKHENDVKTACIEGLIKDNENFKKDISDLNKNIADSKKANDDLTNLINVLNQNIKEIFNSKSWKIGNSLIRLFRIFLPGKKKVSTPTDSAPVVEAEKLWKTQYPNYEREKTLSTDEYKGYLELLFKERKNITLNLTNPKTYCEKIQWMKLYDTDIRRTNLSDKYLVREWVANTIGEQYLIPILGVWDSFDEIDFDSLPDQFVLKANHGCGWNVIVHEKAKLDVVEAREKFDFWLGLDFTFCAGLETQYRGIKPRIIAEEYIENIHEEVFDYKVFCFSGRAEYIQFQTGRYTTLKRAIFDRNWKLQPFVNFHPKCEVTVEKPACLDELINTAEKLSAGFAHVRVDFYILNTGEIKFGEMTFTPASGFYDFDPPEYDRRFGDLIILPSEKCEQPGNADKAEDNNAEENYNN